MPRNHISALELLWYLTGPGDGGGLHELWQLVWMKIQTSQTLLTVAPRPDKGHFEDLELCASENLPSA